MFGSFPGSLGRGQQTKFTGPKEPTPLWNQTPNMRIKTICRDRRASGKVGIGVFFKTLSFQQQEGIGQADQGHMMMPALPAAPFVMIHSQFFFELLIILLHPPDAAAVARRSRLAPIDGVTLDRRGC